MKEASFPALSPTSGFSPAPVPLARHQPQSSLKGQFCFISSGGEDSLCGLYPFSHTMPSPYLESLSRLLTIHQSSVSPSFLFYPLCCPTPGQPGPQKPGPQLWGRVLRTRQRELSPAPAFSSSEQDTGTRVTSESFCSAYREDMEWEIGVRP